jgi:hypothetical protein
MFGADLPPTHATGPGTSVSKQHDAEAVVMAYSCFVESFRSVWLEHNNKKQSPLLSLFQHLNTLSKEALGGCFAMALPEGTSHLFHRTRILFRAIAGCVASALSDAKVDGNGRVAALIYAIMGRKPENTEQDLVAPGKLIWEGDILEQYWTYTCPVDFVVPIDWRNVRFVAHTIGRDTEIERTKGTDFDVPDFIKQYTHALLDLRRSSPEILIARFSLRELQYEKVPGDDTNVVARRCYYPPPTIPRAVRRRWMSERVEEESDRLRDEILQKQLPDDLLKAATVFEGSVKQTFMNGYYSGVWCFPPSTSDTLFTMVLLLYSQYMVVDNLREKDGVVIGSCDAFLTLYSLATTNAVTSDVRSRLTKTDRFCLRLFSPATSEERRDYQNQDDKMKQFCVSVID